MGLRGFQKDLSRPQGRFKGITNAFRGRFRDLRSSFWRLSGVSGGFIIIKGRFSGFHGRFRESHGVSGAFYGFSGVFQGASESFNGS